MLLSVIVPVYNAGEYLKPCLESLLRLPFDKEIIVVDDGSTDGMTPSVPLEGEESREPSVECGMSRVEWQVIRQTNQGVSAARNAGMKLAKGDWLWFVDADDYVNVNDNVFRACSRGAKRNNHNLKPSETFEPLFLSNSSNFLKPSLLVLPFEWEENGTTASFGASDGEVPYNLWRCWFRRAEVERQGLRFTVGRKYAEDQEFILSYITGAMASAKPSSKTQLDGLGASAKPDISHITRAMTRVTYHYTLRASGAMCKPGMKWKQCRDIAAVTAKFFGQMLTRGCIGQGWAWREMKRMIKCLIVTSQR